MSEFTMFMVFPDGSVVPEHEFDLYDREHPFEDNYEVYSVPDEVICYLKRVKDFPAGGC